MYTIMGEHISMVKYFHIESVYYKEAIATFLGKSHIKDDMLICSYRSKLHFLAIREVMYFDFMPQIREKMANCTCTLL